MSDHINCPACQSPLPPDARFCPMCGTAMFEIETHTGSMPPTEWVGERRQVSILFADLGSFTAASEKADPEDVIDMLNTVFTRLMVECEKEGGYLDKTVGDEMMVLFGAPKAHEDDPARAVRAALAMQQEMNNLAGFMRRKVGSICNINIGINTGSVVWGGLGPSGHTALTVIGDAVNLAARLEDYADGGQIVVSEAVYHRTNDLFEYEVLDPIAVKGKSGLIPVYAPLRLKHKASKTQEDIIRDIPFVGREMELDLLHAYWSRAGAGYPQIILLKGEAGLGKTRLVNEFVNGVNKYSHAKHPVILNAHHAGSSHSAYHPLADIISQYFGLVENDTDVIRRRKIEDRISVLGIVSNKFIPLMGYLLGWYRNLKDRATDPETRRNLEYLQIAAIDAAVDLFYKQASRRPTLIIIDDLQGANNQIIEWLNRIIIASQMIRQQQSGFHLMILALSRPRFDAPLNNVEIKNVIELTPFTDDERREMIQCILPGEGLPATLITRLAKESEGNPYYLLEVARELVQSGQLIRTSGRWELTRTVEQIDVPHSIEGLVLAKLDTLTTTDRRVLQHASVIGMSFSETLLEKITPIDQLKNSLQNLLQRGLIKETANTPKERTFSFTQAVVREVTYNSILRKTRRELHELIADISSTNRTTPSQNIEVLAQDYATRGQNEKMIAYNWLAGRHALEKFNFDVAFHHLQMAWDALIEMPNPNPEIYQNLADSLGDASTFTSHFTQAATCYQTAWSLLQNDPERQATLHYKIGRLRLFQGDTNAALEDYMQALQLTAEHPFPQLRAQIEAEIRLLYDLG